MAGSITKKFRCQIEMAGGESLTFIRMPFNVQKVFGKGRVPVKLTVNDYTYKTTICHMGEVWGVPLRREHREKAKVKGGDMVQVSVTPDAEPRIVEVPADLKKFLQQNKVWELFEPLAYTHKKEFVQWISGAKKQETREVRQQKMVQMLKRKQKL